MLSYLCFRGNIRQHMASGTRKTTSSEKGNTGTGKNSTSRRSASSGTGRSTRTSGTGNGSSASRSSSSRRAPSSRDDYVDPRDRYDSSRYDDPLEDTDESLITRDIGLIVLFALMVFLFLSNFGILGPVGGVFSDMMFGLFGFMAYLLPIFVFGAVLYYYAHIDEEDMPRKLSAAIGLFLVLSMICELISGDLANRARYDVAGIYTRCSEHKNGGGLIAGSITYLFYHLFKGFGTVLILIVIAVICIVLLSQKSIINYMGDQAIRAKHRYDDRVQRSREQRRFEEAEREPVRRRQQEMPEEEPAPVRQRRQTPLRQGRDENPMPENTGARFPVYGPENAGDAEKPYVPANVDYSADRKAENQVEGGAEEASSEEASGERTSREESPLSTFNMTHGQPSDANGRILSDENPENEEPEETPQQEIEEDPRDRIANIVLADPAPQESADAGYDAPEGTGDYADGCADGYSEEPSEEVPAEDVPAIPEDVQEEPEEDTGYVPEPIEETKIQFEDLPGTKEPKKETAEKPVVPKKRHDMHEIRLDGDVSLPDAVLSQDAASYADAEDLSRRVIREGLNDVLNQNIREGAEDMLRKTPEQTPESPLRKIEKTGDHKDYSLSSAFDEPLRFGEEDDEVPTDELKGRSILSFDNEDEILPSAKNETVQPAGPSEDADAPEPVENIPAAGDLDAPVPMAEEAHRDEAAPAPASPAHASEQMARRAVYADSKESMTSSPAEPAPKAYETRYDPEEEDFLSSLQSNMPQKTMKEAHAEKPTAAPEMAENPVPAPVSAPSPEPSPAPQPVPAPEPASASFPVPDINVHKDGRTESADHRIVSDNTISSASVVESSQDEKEAQQQAAIARKKEESGQSPAVTAPVHREYIFPPMDLLKKPVPYNRDDSAQELRQTAMKLQNTLETFGVRVKITDISQGPSVTRYEMIPEQGVKVSKIVGLADDIKLALAATDIRIEAPIPGKSAVGIEVPNSVAHVVTLREVINTPEFQQNKSHTIFGVGKDIAGKCVVADIAKMPHVLIAGATGSGKSVCINTIIMSVIYHARPEDVKLIMIDPKVVELSVYNGIPHLLLPVVTDSQKAAATLNWCVAEMEQRFRLFADVGVRDIKGYNALVDGKTREGLNNTGLHHMPSILIIVDELADLMMVAKNDVETAICRLAQLARAAGMHLIIATQRPSVDVITGLIKANMPSRIAFMVTQGVDSRTILDMNGAEKLLGKGDMLFFPQGLPKPQRVQGAFVSDDEVNRVVEYLKVNDPPTEGSKELQNRIDELAENSAASSASQGPDDGRNSDYDELFQDAGSFIIEKQNASIGLLQRRFRIGFNRAARIMDQLCDAGVVGQSEGTKARPILMTEAEFTAWVQENL